MAFVSNLKCFNKTLGSQSGQGIVEYILVLVVTVALVLGLAYQFNDAFRTWAKNYFGDYLACLLETGELPGIGGVETAGICGQLFEPFSLTAGKPLIEPGGNKPGGTTGTGGGPKDQSEANKKPSRSVGHKTASSGGGGASRFRAGFGSSGSGMGGDSVGNRRIKGKEGIYTGSTDGSIPAGALGGSQQSERKTRMRLDRAFGFQQEREEQKKIKVATSMRKGGAQTVREERLPVRRKIAAKDVEEADTEMSFGGFLRMLIIAAIIIALIVFLGGQALQIGKSME